MDELLARNRDLDGWTRRNVGLRTSIDLFNDLAANAQDSAIAAALEADAKRELGAPTQIDRAFAYSVAVEYPFRTEPWLQTRYHDGTHPVWYGSMALETTIHETAYHMARNELGVEGLDEVVVRERAVYDVHIRALLIDLAGARASHPQLTHPSDYSFAQGVGKRIHAEGHPGLISPSDRDEAGENVVVLRPSVLSDPRVSCYLRYHLNPRTRELRVERTPGVEYMRLSYAGTSFS